MQTATPCINAAWIAKLECSGSSVTPPAFVSGATQTTSVAPCFPPLELVTSPTVGTVAAAFYLNRRPQTLRGWACHEDGPLRPRRINGRLAWPVAELRRMLGVV